MHQAEPEAAQFIEGEVAVVAQIGTQQVVRIFRADAGQLVGQHLARHAQAVVVRLVCPHRNRRCSASRCRPDGVLLLDLADEGERIGRQGVIVLELPEARINDSDRLQDIGVLVELEIQRVGDARVRVQLVVLP